MPRWKIIDDMLGLDHPEPVETYSTSAHLFTDLGIPERATGTLPRSRRERLGLEAEELEDIGETGRIRSRVPGGHGSSRRGGSGREPGAGDSSSRPSAGCGGGPGPVSRSSITAATRGRLRQRPRPLSLAGRRLLLPRLPALPMPWVLLAMHARRAAASRGAGRRSSRSHSAAAGTARQDGEATAANPGISAP